MDESLLIGLLTRPLRPVQGAQCLAQPLPPPSAPTRREAWRRGLLQGWAQAPILRAESASCLHLPAAVRLNRHPAWGGVGSAGTPRSPNLT